MIRARLALLGAVALPGVPCQVLDLAGQLYPGTGHIVITSFDASTPALLQCRATLPVAPGRRLVLDYASTGILCTAGREPTTDWAETIDPGGRATLRCRLPGTR